MAHGQPDYGMYSLASTIYRLTDMGELAARLGSGNRHDRRGNVLYASNFAGGINEWATTVIGAGSEVTWSPDMPYVGGFCCRLHTGTAAFNYAKARIHLPYPSLSMIGVEAAIAINYYHDATFISLDMYLDGVQYNGQIRYDAATDSVNLYLAGGGFEELLPKPNLSVSEGRYHIFKLVIDAETKKHTRLILDSHVYDLSGYDIYQQASISGDQLVAAVWVQTDDTAGRDSYLGNVIVTHNEM